MVISFTGILLSLKLDGIAARALDAAIAPATAAQGHILVITAYLDLIAVGDNVTGGIDAGVDDGLAAT